MEAQPSSPSARLRDFARRFVMIYLVAYVAPFPLKFVPGLEELLGLASAPWSWLVTWTGDVVFGVEAVPRYNGSGDTMYDWVEVACLLAAATVAALVWRRPVGARAADRVRAYVGLYLGATMLMYGWVKLLPVQFLSPGPARLIVPIGELEPGELMWLFMGVSMGYEIALGLVEVIAGTLLFWRRTALLGALISMGVMANVLAMNLGYDIGVKLLSAHLLMFALFVAAPDLRRLLHVALGHPAEARDVDPFPIASKTWRRLRAGGKAALMLIIAAVNVVQALPYLRPSPSPLRGVYHVEAFAQDGRVGDAIPASERWSQIGLDPIGQASVVTADGRSESFGLAIDEGNHTLTWRRQDGTSLSLSYEEQQPDLLRIWGDVDGRSLSGSLRRDDRRFELTEHRTRLIIEGRR